MPRFHLHIRTPTELIEDGEGSEFPDCAQAIDEAVRGARCLMRGEIRSGTLCLQQSIEIHDAAGMHMRTVPFGEAVRLIESPEPAVKSGTAERRS